MRLPRRAFLQLSAGAVALPVCPGISSAQAYPSRPVHFLVGYAPGGGNDIVARLMGQWLSERLGQPFLIENRPGAGTNVATEAVARAPADGYTLLAVGQPNAVNAALYPKLSFDFIRDIAPVAGFMMVPDVIVVHPSLPVTTVPELIAYAKANPDRVNMASAGTGSAAHLAGELFKLMTGVPLLHVPYRGQAPALTSLIGGQVQVMFPSIPSSIEHIRAGKLRALAITATVRSDVLPDLPLAGEFVPGYEASAWYGAGVPKHTPGEIVDRLNSEINAGLADPKLRSRLADMGGTALAGSPADFGKLIAEETEKWGKVIRAAGIKAD
jgi:tripartite-type tricarboxylate transporter receptor subunit TctC